MPASYRFVVRGQVQGVGFRYTAVGRARVLGLSGWIRNRADGNVEGIASGPPEALHQFRSWLERGPPAAQVENVEWVADAAEPAGSGFVIQR